MNASEFLESLKSSGAWQSPATGSAATPMPSQMPEQMPAPQDGTMSQPGIVPEPIASDVPQMLDPMTINGASPMPSTMNPTDLMKSAADGTVKGFEQQQQALLKQAEIGKEKAVAETAQMMTQNEIIRAQEEYAQKIEQERQVKLQEQDAKLTNLTEQYAGMKVDPNRLYANGSTAGKIMTGIGLIMGSFGAGNTNGSVAIIENAINRDIEQQKFAIEKKGADISNQKGILVEMRQQFGDQRVAENAARSILIERAQRDLTALGSKFVGPEQQAKAEALMGQLEAQKQTALQNIGKDLDNSSQQRASLAMQRENLKLQQGLRADALDAKQQAKADALTVMVDKRDPATGEITQVPMQARDPQAAKKAREQMSATQELVKTINQAIEFRKTVGPTMPMSANNNLAKELQADMVLKIKKADELGALDAGVLKIGGMLASNPGAWSAGVGKVLEDYKGKVLSNGNSKVRQYGDGFEILDPTSTASKSKEKAYVPFPPR